MPFICFPKLDFRHPERQRTRSSCSASFGSRLKTASLSLGLSSPHVFFPSLLPPAHSPAHPPALVAGPPLLLSLGSCIPTPLLHQFRIPLFLLRASRYTRHCSPLRARPEARSLLERMFALSRTRHLESDPFTLRAYCSRRLLGMLVGEIT